jgi:hypothetical protein
MLETHQLRIALAANRQELAHALYLQDAATRVIARCHSLFRTFAASSMFHP